MTEIERFDTTALGEALDAARKRRGLSWQQLADAVWGQSAELNAERDDHPFAAGTPRGIGSRPGVSAQHALFVLRWLELPPEAFLEEAPGELASYRLPNAGPDQRLRWNLARLADALDAERVAQGLTWTQVASTLGCTPGQLTEIKHAKFGLNMTVAMAVTQWLERPAADFVDAARW
jgi:transcriptional regulator with XRE-family HTH domain